MSGGMDETAWMMTEPKGWMEGRLKRVNEQNTESERTTGRERERETRGRGKGINVWG